MSEILTATQQEQIQKLVIPEEGWIRDFVDCYHGHVEAPDEALAGVAYTLLSAVVGWRSYLKWAKAAEPLHLYTVLVGGSATAHKTTVLRIGESMARETNELFRHRTGADEDTPDLVKVIAGGHLSAAKLLDYIAPETDEEAKRVNQPGRRIPHFLLSWDEMGDLMVNPQGPNGHFLAETKHMLLRTYGGEQPGSQTRSNYKPSSRCALALMGTITARGWAESLTEQTVTGGFMGRMLALPLGAAPEWLPMPPPVLEAKHRPLVSWLADLGATPYPDWGPVSLTPEALSFWKEWYIGHKKQVAEIERVDPVTAEAAGALFGRYQATALKFAGLQMVSRWAGTSCPQVQVDLEVLTNATSYIDLALAQATIVATDAMEPEEERFIRKVTSLLEVTERIELPELQRRVRIRGIDRTRFHRLLDMMDQEGQCVLHRTEHQTVRGPRTKITVERA